MSVVKSVELRFTMKQIITLTSTTTTTTTTTTTSTIAPYGLIKKFHQIIKAAPVPNMEENQITTMSEFFYYLFKNYFLKYEKKFYTFLILFYCLLYSSL